MGKPLHRKQRDQLDRSRPDIEHRKIVNRKIFEIRKKFRFPIHRGPIFYGYHSVSTNMEVLFLVGSPRRSAWHHERPEVPNFNPNGVTFYFTRKLYIKAIAKFTPCERVDPVGNLRGILMVIDNKTPKYIRINDAVARYSLSRSTFNRALKSGDLVAMKKGAAVLLEVETVDRWITGEEDAE